MEIRFRKANGWMRVTDLYEWSVNVKWYRIRRENILALQGPSQEREIMNQALNGATLSLEALYLRTSKLLLISERA